MDGSHWRRKSRRVILAAIEEAKALGLEGLPLRKFVGDRYPFGERANWPYKIWLSEMTAQLGPRENPRKRPGDVPADYWTSLLSGGQS